MSLGVMVDRMFVKWVVAVRLGVGKQSVVV